jgi:two-component sensor histidine kinase
MKDEDEIKQLLIAELEKFCREMEGKARSGKEHKKEKKFQEKTMKLCRKVNRLNDSVAILQDGIIKCVSPGRQAREDCTISAYIFSRVLALNKQYTSGGSVWACVEFEIFDKEGEKKFVELKRNLILHEGRPAELLIIHDVTDRKESEKKLNSLLKEKDIMMREIHHRVKNNMQIISSLLRLQSRRLKNQKIIEMFRASQTRIRSMVLIHENLYQSENLTEIDFGRYIKNLGAYLFHTYKVDANRLKFNINTEHVFLEIDAAIPLGLIVNELVSNSLRHAFPDGRKGEIGVSIRLDNTGKIFLEVSDTGVGMTQGWDFRRAKTLGMQLVKILVTQIGGAIELRRDGGTAFAISFYETK